MILTKSTDGKLIKGNDELFDKNWDKIKWRDNKKKKNANIKTKKGSQ